MRRMLDDRNDSCPDCLPPTWRGAADAHRDETVSYLSRSGRPGGDTELHIWSGGFPGFDQMAPDAAVSRDARRAQVDWLRGLLAR